MAAAKLYSVDSLTHEAKGVARDQGKVTFIAGALPGETVKAQVVQSNKRFDQANLLDIEQPSQHRQSPPCPHFEQCGGCSFQHLTLAQQRVAKQSWLQGQLRKVWPDGEVSQLTDQAMGYRRRARLAIRVNEQNVSLGFRGKSSQHIVNIDNCLVLTPNLQQVFLALKNTIKKDAIAAKLGHIELLEDEQGLAVLFRLTTKIPPEQQAKWQEWANQQNVKLYWQRADEKRAHINPENIRHYQLDDLTLQYHPQDFIQVNSAMNQKMVKQAIDWLAPNRDDVILDLFCGVGNFSLPLATKAKRVVGVEVQASMVAAGNTNAQINDLTNLSFIAADLTQKPSREIMGLGVTKVLLDPPRAGAFEFLPSLIKLKPTQILYVSCDGATLARDAEFLVAQGYKVQQVAMMDMFPQTAHLETMMLLTR